MVKRSGKSQFLILVKADAYGHSQVEVAKCLEKHRLSSRLEGFGVANVEEAIELRRAQIKKPIYVMSGVQSFGEEEYRCFRDCTLVPVVSSMHVLDQMLKTEKRLSSRGKYAPISFQLKFNTGMNRLGIEAEDAHEALQLIKKFSLFRFEGILSHFATAESKKDSLTRSQIANFRRIEKMFRPESVKWNHMANSLGFRNQLYPEGNLNRIGVHIYGLGPTPLKPVATWRAQVYQVRELKKGDTVGYGARFKASKSMKMAVLGVGYADGYRRSYYPGAHVLLHGKKCKVIGSVSMDLTAIDVSACKNVKPGDMAVLIGKQGANSITADDLAKISKTISYEVMTGISSRVPRYFYGQ